MLMMLKNRLASNHRVKATAPVIATDTTNNFCTSRIIRVASDGTLHVARTPRLPTITFFKDYNSRLTVVLSRSIFSIALKTCETRGVLSCFETIKIVFVSGRGSGKLTTLRLNHYSAEKR